MGTTLRSELSPNNKYWIGKHRYLELKHFCLQYPVWKSKCLSEDGLSRQQHNLAGGSTNSISDPTARSAEVNMSYTERVHMIESAAKKADSELCDYILRGVTEGRSYTNLSMQFAIPCCRDVYYDRYRKFFWLLNKERR